MTRKLIALLVLGVGITACDTAPADNTTAESTTAESTAATADRTDATTAEADAEVVYVDVRTPEEFASGHVEGAINIPHTEMRQRHEELEPYADRQIVLYCQSGRRSGIAKEILEDEGFTSLVNGGGFRDLQAEGVPTTR